MSKRRLKRVPKAVKTDPTGRLRQALGKRKKDELVAVLVELARADRGIFRQTTKHLQIETPPSELVDATHHAILDATDFDERDVNRNFDYDYQAYEEVQRNLARLVDLGQLRSAMALSLELMKEGSYQVAMSDEGLMSEEIEGCLNVVVKAVAKCDLPASEVRVWCDDMLASDQVGSLCDRELKTLRQAS